MLRLVPPPPVAGGECITPFFKRALVRKKRQRNRVLARVAVQAPGKSTAVYCRHSGSRAQRKPILWWPAVARRDTLAPRQAARKAEGPVSAAPPRVTRSAILSGCSRPSSARYG